MALLPDEIERWLRVDLEKAQEEFCRATLEEKPKASERLRQALDAFTAFILKGELPKRPARSGDSDARNQTAA